MPADEGVGEEKGARSPLYILLGLNFVLESRNF
jgi:hypothetical protein